MAAVCRMPQVEEASAAKLEELRLGAVSQGKEWLSRSLSEMSARQPWEVGSHLTMSLW